MGSAPMIRPDWLLLIGLAPMMLGPLSSGGVIRIPVDGDEPDQVPEQPCFKACHAGNCRKRSDKGDTLELE